MIADETYIVSYNSVYQSKIDALMTSISEEYLEPISLPKQNHSLDLVSNLDLYLLAFCNDHIVGTISLTKLENGNSALKKMFIHKNFRRQGIANSLLEKATKWAIENNVKTIYLGTMKQFIVAQKFYEKKGFEKISAKLLPEDFTINPVDRIFYQMKLV